MRGEDDGWVCVWLFEKLHTYLAELDPLGPRGLDARQVQRIEFLSGTPPPAHSGSRLSSIIGREIEA